MKLNEDIYNDENNENNKYSINEGTLRDLDDYLYKIDRLIKTYDNQIPYEEIKKLIEETYLNTQSIIDHNIYVIKKSTHIFNSTTIY